MAEEEIAYYRDLLSQVLCNTSYDVNEETLYLDDTLTFINNILINIPARERERKGIGRRNTVLATPISFQREVTAA